MSKTVKIAISLPDDLFKKIEKSRKTAGETRSSFIKRAIEKTLSDREKNLLVDKYIQGYIDFPETKEEIAAAESFSISMQNERMTRKA